MIVTLEVPRAWAPLCMTNRFPVHNVTARFLLKAFCIYQRNEHTYPVGFIVHYGHAVRKLLRKPQKLYHFYYYLVFAIISQTESEIFIENL